MLTRFTIIAALLAAAVWFLCAWYKWLQWRLELQGDQNELDCLEETVQSYEQGRYENPEYIKRQISDIERHHKALSPEAERLLGRARCAIELRRGGPVLTSMQITPAELIDVYDRVEALEKVRDKLAALCGADAYIGRANARIEELEEEAVAGLHRPKPTA
jgi:hypothetical protein